MSTICSIPGCNVRSSVLKQIKLYRVPGIEVASSGLIYNLTIKRRQNWLDLLKSCGLEEKDLTDSRVCSNHFVDGKPSPIFDTKNKDWLPNINLPIEISTEANTSIEDKNEKPLNRQNARGATRRKLETEPRTHIRSKSVGRTKNTKHSNNLSRSKSVGRFKERNDRSTSKEIETDPFVFVDVEKIKAGTSIALKESTEKLLNNYEAEVDDKNNSRTFGTQTNPNVLPPLNWGRRKYKKQKDPRYQTKETQTEESKSFNDINSSQQVGLGEVIDFIRNKVLDFDLKALGNNFKIKECALLFEKEQTEISGSDDKIISVVVHPNRLLSSNWKLLESVAMSLDLYRLHNKNENESTGFVRTVVGKTELIQQLPNNKGKTHSVEIKKHLPNSQRYKKINQVPLSDQENTRISLSSENDNDDKDGDDDNHNTSQSENINHSPTISPVMPKITSVISLGELFDGNTQKRKKLYTSPTIELKKKSNTRSLNHLNKRLLPYEKNLNIQTRLGTTKVPRIILEKLPDNLLQSAQKGIPIKISLVKNKSDAGKIIAASKINSQRIISPKPQNTSPTKPISLNTFPANANPEKIITPFLLLNNSLSIDDNQIKSTINDPKTPISFNAIKNIPLKLPQTKGVAGYLLLPNASTTGNPTPIMYVPKVGNACGTPVNVSQNMSTYLLSNVLSSKQNTNTTSENNSPIPALINTIRTTQTKNNDENDTNKDEVNEKNDGEMKENADSYLRCPYCKKYCKNGLEFIDHKASGCWKRKISTNKETKCEKCNITYMNVNHECSFNAERGIPTCTLCRRTFAKNAHLANHLRIHPEYSTWSEKCFGCPRKFPNEAELQDHVKEFHVSSTLRKQYKCDKCEKRYYSLGKLKIHTETSHKQQEENLKENKRIVRIRCKDCGFVCELEHYRSVHWQECEGRKRNDEWEADIGKEKKKPTAIRSKKTDKLETSIEKQLSRMFDENYNSEESEYENEELLTEDLDKEETKINQDVDKKRSSDTVLEEPKIKMMKPEINEQDEENEEKIDVNALKALLVTDDGPNEIIFEEMEDED